MFAISHLKVVTAVRRRLQNTRPLRKRAVSLCDLILVVASCVCTLKQINTYYGRPLLLKLEHQTVRFFKYVYNMFFFDSRHFVSDVCQLPFSNISHKMTPVFGQRTSPVPVPMAVSCARPVADGDRFHYRSTYHANSAFHPFGVDRWVVSCYLS